MVVFLYAGFKEEKKHLLDVSTINCHTKKKKDESFIAWYSGVVNISEFIHDRKVGPDFSEV